MKNNFLRLELSTPILEVANISSNYKTISESIKIAVSKNTDMIVLPRLSLTTPNCKSMLNNQMLQNAIYKTLESIVELSKKLEIVIILGLPFSYENHIVDTSCVIYKGSICGLSTLSNNSNEIYSVELIGQKISLGNNRYSINKTMSFCIIGGDNNYNPTGDIVKNANSVDLIINMQSSYMSYDTNKNTADLLSSLSKSTHTIIAHISNNSLLSSYGKVHSGEKIIIECGEILVCDYLSQQININTEIDFLYAQHSKTKQQNTITLDSITSKNTIDINKPLLTENIIRKYNPYPYVANHTYNENILDILAIGLYAKMQELKTTKVIFGLSGGLDSTMVLIVCDRVCKKYAIPSSNILTVTMRGMATSNRSEDNAVSLTKCYNTTHIDIDITKAVKSHLQDINHTLLDVTYENSQARERAKILLNLSNKHSALHLGTGDLSEIALGWSTYGGDQLAQFNINNSLTKSQIRALVQYTIKITNNKTISNILQDILDAPVSPELVPNQKTETILGPYELHDFFLYHIIHRGSSIETVFNLSVMTYNKLSKTDIKGYLKLFLARFFKNQFKRKYSCDGIQVHSTDLTDFELDSNFDPQVLIEQLDKLN